MRLRLFSTFYRITFHKVVLRVYPMKSDLPIAVLSDQRRLDHAHGHGQALLQWLRAHQ